MANSAATSRKRLREGRPVKGRELLRVVCAYYETNKTADVVYRFSDLGKLKLNEQNDLENFQNN